ncbi:MAG: HAMP domain-containing histidine kinase [Bacteriovoracaceae bacterium]|nr:HAMP domain-containing histidine kinase [Bacteriovoracaceae bacterium]
MKKNIRTSFLVVMSVTIGLVTLIAIFVYAIYQRNQFETELRSSIQNQAKQIIATHPEERKTHQYLIIQRLLKNINNVESVVVLDKDCKTLLGSISLPITDGICPSNQEGLLVLPYSDVLSGIGFIVIKIEIIKFAKNEVLLVLGLSILLALIVFFALKIIWEKYLYNPLLLEIQGIVSSDKRETFSEFKPIINHLDQLLIEKTFIIKRKIELESEEKKFKEAIKVAHDILNPIQVLKSNSSTDLKLKALDQIEKTAWDLLPEKAPLFIESLNVNNLISQVIDILRSEFPELNVSFNGHEEFYAQVSSTHFLRSFQNLLKNAIEVQSNNVPIEIWVSANIDYVTIQINDNGPGFTDKAGVTTKVHGSGVGISSAKASLELMNGSLSYESRPEGGIRTVINLPSDQIHLFYGPKQVPVTFGVYIPGIMQIMNANELCSNHYVISVFDPRSEFNGVWKKILVSDLSRIKLIKIEKALLVDDDKYILANWVQKAQQVGIDLKVEKHKVDVVTEEVVFLDRYLDGFDSFEWQQELVRIGKSVVSISGLNSRSKIPPWS